MKQDLEKRIAELRRMTEAQLKAEHLRVFGWEPMFERRREMLEKLISELRDPRQGQDSNTDTKE